jgi:hypothetical protein
VSESKQFIVNQPIRAPSNTSHGPINQSQPPAILSMDLSTYQSPQQYFPWTNQPIRAPSNTSHEPINLSEPPAILPMDQSTYQSQQQYFPCTNQPIRAPSNTIILATLLLAVSRSKQKFSLLLFIFSQCC